MSKWISEAEAERKTGMPREVLCVLAGNTPSPHGTPQERSVRRRIVLEFWGRCRDIDIFNGLEGMLPEAFAEDVKWNNDAVSGKLQDRKILDFDNPEGHPLFACYAYIKLIVDDRLLKISTFDEVFSVLARDISDGPPWCEPVRRDARSSRTRTRRRGKGSRR